ncbi:MAG: ABC transporter permease [Cyclobacteriaceae bacterium]|nr:ABC transporter permease [Cyclobacteriaceae bacterium]
MEQLKQLVIVHFKEFYREPGIIFWAIVFPILLAIGLGFAFTDSRDERRTIGLIYKNTDSTDWLNEEHFRIFSEGEMKLGNKKLGYTTFHFEETDRDGAMNMIKQGKSTLAISIEADSLNYHFDPANPEARLSYLLLSGYFNGYGDKTGDQIVVLKQTGMRYIDFLVPGLMAMGIMMNCMWGISYNNVDKRSKKLLRRLVATPMKKSNYVIAQFITRLSLSFLEAVLLLSVTHWIFGITITGSIGALLLMFISGNIAFTGIAMLTSSRTSNPQIANGLINLVVLPMMVLSGIYFSYHNFPDDFIRIIKLLPLTILSDAMRSIFIEGRGVLAVLPAAGILISLGAVLYTLALKIYKWY